MVSGTAARSRGAAWSAMARAPARSAPPCWCRRRGRPRSARPSPTRSAPSSRCRAPARPAARPRWSALQMAIDRINKSGGINGRPIELIVADDESKPDVGRRKAEKLLVEDKVDAHVGGFLSNICLACMPVFEEHKVAQHDQRLPRHHADHHASATATASGRSTTRRRRRWRSRLISSTSWARGGTSPSPTMPGASRRATPTPSRSRRPAARSSGPPASRSAPPT